MSTWTYHRGMWIEHKEYPPQSKREALARERLTKWELQRRWQRFEDKLGPLPSKWANVGPPPVSRMERINEALTGYYLGPLRSMLNEESPLLRYLQEKGKAA